MKEIKYKWSEGLVTLKIISLETLILECNRICVVGILQSHR